MDLIYIILSVLLRLFPAVRNLSNRTSLVSNRRRDLEELAVWLPLFGWVSVSVQHMPQAQWLTWRVRDIRSFNRISHDMMEKRNQSRNVNPLRRPKVSPTRDKSPD